jgi:hypothetical protein
MICPYCKKAELEYQQEWDMFCDYYYCPECDSTYTVQEKQELDNASVTANGLGILGFHPKDLGSSPSRCTKQLRVIK